MAQRSHHAKVRFLALVLTLLIVKMQHGVLYRIRAWSLRTHDPLYPLLPHAHAYLQVDLISPTPLLMTIAEKDVLTPTHIALDVYSKAKEPKQLNILKGAGHFDGYVGTTSHVMLSLILLANRYTGKWFKQNSETQLAFFKNALL